MNVQTILDTILDEIKKNLIKIVAMNILIITKLRNMEFS